MITFRSVHVTFCGVVVSSHVGVVLARVVHFTFVFWSQFCVVHSVVEGGLAAGIAGGARTGLGVVVVTLSEGAISVLKMFISIFTFGFLIFFLLLGIRKMYVDIVRDE